MSTEVEPVNFHSMENTHQIVPSEALEFALNECHEMLEKIQFQFNPDMKMLKQPKYFRGFALAHIIYQGKVDLALEMLALYPPDELQIPNTTHDQYYHTMDNAARAHSLELLKQLHERSLGKCSVNAMDTAATIGDLEMVRFLHENRTEGCSRRAFKKAKKRHHDEVLAYLEANCPEGQKVSAPIRHGDVDPRAAMMCTIQ